MEYFNRPILMNSAGIISVVRRSLSKIDPRLVDHGERVAFIARKIYLASGGAAGIDLTRLFILCVLHDIGAYKTEEIDGMVRFETDTTYDHSIYGYLLIKSMPHLSEYAPAVLCHHTGYDTPEMRACPCAEYAQLINLADRIDVLTHFGPYDLNTLRKKAGTTFNPDYVEAFFRAEDETHITDMILSGGYKEEFDALEGALDIKVEQIMDYLRLLVYAIDFRSPHTVTHTADTTIISLETGRLMGLDERTLRQLYTGAFLHDIGKIAIPGGILEKPGRLTPAETDTMRGHVAAGADILQGVVSQSVCDIALRHHEKLDGSGYPYGLHGRSLNLPQRIVAVADILSALSMRRSYKEPFPKSKTIALLNEMKEAGQLCPRVVDTVIANYDLIFANVRKSHDPVKTLYDDVSREYASLRARRLAQAAAHAGIM